MLYEKKSPSEHFMGSLVTWPVETTAEKGLKLMLIDGQQRLTTLLIILALLRDKAKEAGNEKLAKEIEEDYLVNRFLTGIDRYKLLPTHMDCEVLNGIMEGHVSDDYSLLSEAYYFFRKKLAQGDENGAEYDISRLWGVLSSKLACVSITLSEDDNPYLIFETLNAKGLPLTQADLIRNFFFMKIPLEQQEDVYKKSWKPMEESLGEWLTQFMWHYLMKDGDIIPERDIYRYAKLMIESRLAKGGKILDVLDEITKYANYYDRMLKPQQESNVEVSKKIKRLNDWWIGTSYPFLLNVYNDFDSGRLSADEFWQVLDTIESFVIRREVCGVPSRPLNRIFVGLYSSIQSKAKEEQGKRTFVELLQEELKTHEWPIEEDFIDGFKTYKAYEASVTRCNLLLESLEKSYGHPEPVDFVNLEIEHIMPQTLTDWWKENLGQEWQTVHDKYLHTIGNLTLIAAPKNPELSNSSFSTKKEWFARSNLELSKHISKTYNSWTEKEILERAEHLAHKALDIWKR